MIPREILKKIRQIEIRTNRIVTETLAGISPVCLFFLCSCATPRAAHSITTPAVLPSDVSINEEAGRGGWLTVILQLKDGEKLPFVVDTGSSWTILDASLEKHLGSRRGVMTTTFLGAKRQLSRHASPQLYLGNTLLVIGSHVYTMDLKQLRSETGAPIMGIIGMDCLQHYCIQLDFEAGKLRFLQPSDVNPFELGEAIPIALKYLPFIQSASVFETQSTNRCLIDAGINIDGTLNRPLFPDGSLPDAEGSPRQPIKAATGSRVGCAVWFPQREWNGHTYTNLVISSDADMDTIGLRFLARHLVTLDFPRKRMYLKQTSTGPLAGDTLLGKINDAIESPSAFLEDLKTKGRLPGWSNVTGKSLLCVYHPHGDSNAYTFAYRDNQDALTHHYQVYRNGKSDSWNLRKAWAVDSNNRKIEEYFKQ